MTKNMKRKAPPVHLVPTIKKQKISSSAPALTLQGFWRTTKKPHPEQTLEAIEGLIPSR